MSAASNYLENELLDHVLGGGDYTAPATLYAALCTAVVVDVDTGSTITEPAGNNYARLAITANSTNFPAAAAGSIANGAVLVFATPSGAWGSVSDIAICDASSAGNVLVYKALATAISPTALAVPMIKIGGLTVSIATNISTYLANELLDHVFGGAAYTRPATLYMALCTAAPTASSTGSTITEPSGNGYARKSITNDATNFPAASGGAKTNGAEILFATPSGAWGSCTHWALCDASSAGNVLLFGELTASVSPVAADQVRFAGGAFDFTLS